MTWDYENRLTKMEKTKGTDRQTVTFRYDPFGRRIEKKQSITKSGATKTSTWTYVYDGYDIALEIYTDAASATTKTFYTHGQNIDEHLALERNGNFYYYHADGLGSVTTITDANRQKVQSYSYDSFGKITPQTSFANSFTFTGREWDKETGLYYYRARYYDPMEGRFVSKDPLSFAAGDVNLYGMVQENPINYTDPLGLRCKSFKDNFADNIRMSNSVIFGDHIKTLIGFTTSGSVARSLGTVTALQVLINAARTGTVSIANMTTLGTLASAGVNMLVNGTLVAGSLEAGIVIGSGFNALIQTNLQQDDCRCK